MTSQHVGYRTNMSQDKAPVQLDRGLMLEWSILCLDKRASPKT